MSANLENSAVTTEVEKASFHFSPEGQCQKRSNYWTTALISHASKVVLKSFKLGFSNMKIQMYKLDLEKAEEPEIKLPTFVGS